MIAVLRSSVGFQFVVDDVQFGLTVSGPKTTGQALFVGVVLSCVLASDVRGSLSVVVVVRVVETACFAGNVESHFSVVRRF